MIDLSTGVWIDDIYVSVKCNVGDWSETSSRNYNFKFRSSAQYVSAAGALLSVLLSIVASG